MPPSTVAGQMIYLGWVDAGRGAVRPNCFRLLAVEPGGRALTELPLTLAHRIRLSGVYAVCGGEQLLGDAIGARQRMEISQVDWIRSGVINALA